MLRLIIALIAFLPVATLALVDERSVRPGINEAYEHTDFSLWVSRFERPGREVFDRREDIVRATGVKRGMTVADIGAGTGLFTWPFAEQVGHRGKVYAVDISKVFVENLRRLAREKRLPQVEVVHNVPRSAALPEQSLDVAFVCDTYHHFEFPGSMLRSIHFALKPGGVLLLVDFERAEGVSSDWVMGHVRAGRETVVHELQAMGFELIDEPLKLDVNYMLRFRRK